MHRDGQAALAAFWPHEDAQCCRLLRASESVWAGQRWNGQVAGARDTVYGSDGSELDACGSLSARRYRVRPTVLGSVHEP